MSVVVWNPERPDFQSCWLWQYGNGPFAVLERHTINEQGGFLGEVQMLYEPGEWLYIGVPQAAHQYRVEYGIEAVLFHSMWFKPHHCTCSLCYARALQVDPMELALKNDPIGLRLWRKNPGEPYYRYRQDSEQEQVLRAKHAADPQQLLFNIHRYGSDSD